MILRIYRVEHFGREKKCCRRREIGTSCWPNLGHYPAICGRGTEYKNVRTEA